MRAATDPTADRVRGYSPPRRNLHAEIHAAASHRLLRRNARLPDEHERLKAIAGFILSKDLKTIANRDVQAGVRLAEA